MVNLHFPMVEIPFPDISSSKSQSVDLFSFSTPMLSSVQSLVIQSQQSTKSDVLHRTVLSIIYHHQMDIIEQASTNILMTIFIQ